MARCRTSEPFVDTLEIESDKPGPHTLSFDASLDDPTPDRSGMNLVDLRHLRNGNERARALCSVLSCAHDDNHMHTNFSTSRPKLLEFNNFGLFYGFSPYADRPHTDHELG